MTGKTVAEQQADARAFYRVFSTELEALVEAVNTEVTPRQQQVQDRFLGTLDEACFAVVTRDGRDHNWRRSDEQVGDVRSPPCGPGITAVQAARPASSRVPMTHKARKMTEVSRPDRSCRSHDGHQPSDRRVQVVPQGHQGARVVH